MKKIKVCHLTIVSQFYIPRLLRESSSLSEEEFDVFIISEGRRYKKNNITFIGNIGGYDSRLKMYSYASEIVKKAIELNADIYQFHNPIFLLFAKKIKSLGKKVIFDSHEFYGLQIKEKKYFPKLMRSVISSLYMKYESYICKKIDAVIQVCTVEGINYFEGRCKKSIFLANYVDFAQFKLDDITKENSVIHVGILNHNRGITHLVEAAEFSNATVKLAGSFSPSDYEQILRNKKGFENIDYLGVLDRKQVAEELSKSIAGVSTLLNVGQYNKIDTLPTKMYEYMLIGLPIIFSKNNYNDSLNDKYHFGIGVEPDNPKQIADAINYIKSNPVEAQIMGKNGQRLVEEIFNWNIEKQKLLKLYQEIL